MTEISSSYIVAKKTGKEIIFQCPSDLHQFFDDVTNGKWVLITSPDENGVLISELIRPDVKAEIADGRLMLKAYNK